MRFNEIQEFEDILKLNWRCSGDAGKVLAVSFEKLFAWPLFRRLRAGILMGVSAPITIPGKITRNLTCRGLHSSYIYIIYIYIYIYIYIIYIIYIICIYIYILVGFLRFPSLLQICTFDPKKRKGDVSFQKSQPRIRKTSFRHVLNSVKWGVPTMRVPQ